MAPDDTEAEPLRSGRLALSIANHEPQGTPDVGRDGRRRRCRRTAGNATLGPYAGGGLGQFLIDYLADLARLRAGAWTLLLGPVVVVAAWRVIVALAWPGRPATGRKESPEGRRPAPAERRDPTIGRLTRE